MSAIAQLLLFGVTKRMESLSFVPYMEYEEKREELFFEELHSSVTAFGDLLRKEMAAVIKKKTVSKEDKEPLLKAGIDALETLLVNDRGAQAFFRRHISPIKADSEKIKIVLIAMRLIPSSSFIHYFTEGMKVGDHPAYIRKLIWVPQELADPLDIFIHDIVVRTILIIRKERGGAFHRRLCSIQGNSLFSTLLVMEERDFSPNAVRDFCKEVAKMVGLLSEALDNDSDKKYFQFWSDVKESLFEILVRYLRSKGPPSLRLLVPSIEKLASEFGFLCKTPF